MMSAREHAELRRAVLRLTVQTVGMLVLFLLIVGGLVYSIVSAGQKDSAERTLIESAQLGSPADAPMGVFVAIYSDGEWQLSDRMPGELPDLEAVEELQSSGLTVVSRVTIDEHSYLVRTSQDGGRITQVALDQNEAQEELDRLLSALLISGVLAAAAAGFIAAWMARRAMRPLAEALALQRRFIADASHELRTPLTLLSTRAQMLRRSLPDAAEPAAEPATEAEAEIERAVPVAQKVDEIVQDARLLTAILDDLLIAADPRQVAETAAIDLVSVADDAVGSLRPEAERRGLRLAREGRSGTVMIRGSLVSIHRLYTALITNALDFAESDVTVEVRRSGKDAVIRVSDDGPGFPSGTDDRVFERFATTRSDAEQLSSGSRHYGLGLAVVAEIAARHGGKVSLEQPQPHSHGAVVAATLPTVD